MKGLKNLPLVHRRAGLLPSLGFRYGGQAVIMLFRMLDPVALRPRFSLGLPLYHCSVVIHDFGEGIAA